MTTTARRPGERGSATLELVAGLAVLVLPVVALIAVLPSWAEAATAAEAAAAEAGRVATAEPDPAAGEAAGADAGERVLRNRNVEGSVRVAVDTDADGAPARSGVATAEVTVRLPALQLPTLGGVGGMDVTREHHEPLDRWRGFGPDG